MQGYFYSFFCAILKYKRGYSMPKMKKCTICGKNFLSRNGIEVCSAACAAERKHRQDTAGNERRKAQLSNQKSKSNLPGVQQGFYVCVLEILLFRVRRNRTPQKLSRKQPGILRPKSGYYYPTRKSYTGEAQADTPAAKIKAVLSLRFHAVYSLIRL